MKSTSAPNQVRNVNELSIVLAVLLVLFLPLAARYRSPGGVTSAWYWIASAAVALLMLNIWGLKALWQERWGSRIGVYLSSGIAVGVFMMLIHFWQEQQQFDIWSHHGIRYFDEL